MRVNEDDGVVYKQPTTEAERVKVASECQAGLKLAIPVLVDDMANTANRAYAGWPDRLYVIDASAKIAYKGGPGPGGFRPQEMEQALVKLLKE